MLLTDAKIRGLRAKERQYKVADGGGLYLHVTPGGGKLWRYKYRFGGKEKSLSLGGYPDVKLVDARKKHRAAREQVADGVDPAAVKREEKFKQAKTFEAVATEWHEKQKDGWTAEYAATVWRRLEVDVLPWMKDRPVDDISSAEILQALRRVELRGAVDTAHRICQYMANIFSYALICGYTPNNPAAGLVKALKATLKRNMASITEPKQIKELLRAIDGFQGSFVVRQALRMAPLVFVRPGELRAAEWSELDLDGGLWEIPAGRMKMKRPHLVPLSRQAVEILRELEPLTGQGKYVFPSVRTPAKPISENTINAALRRLGYDKEQMTGHGFRTMASTRLHELGWKSEVIEFQLAHADKNKIRGVYNRAEYLEERKRMMQAWGDYLDGLRSGNKVVPLFERKV
jgi:integrase